MKNGFEIRGNQVAIFLKHRDGTRSEAIIDLLDLPKVQGIRGTWRAAWCPDTKSYYVLAHSREGDKWKTIHLHRLIMDTPKGLVVDHRNRDTLLNTRKNLRNVTRAENLQNISLRKTNQSGHRGVSWDKSTRKWVEQINSNGKVIHLGLFTDIELAAEVAHQARVKLMPGYLG